MAEVAKWLGTDRLGPAPGHDASDGCRKIGPRELENDASRWHMRATSDRDETV